MSVTISKGFGADERAQIAMLYWEAFGAKLSKVMGPEPLALTFIADQLNPDFALIARGPDQAIRGVAGFKTAKGALVGGEMKELAAAYGWLSALWRGPLLALVERELSEDVLLMDGICVATDARGTGVGTQLLTAVKEEAAARGLASVRLDVIDTNPRAKALYERQGFRAMGQQTLGPFAWIFGFRSSTKMIYP